MVEEHTTSSSINSFIQSQPLMDHTSTTTTLLRPLTTTPMASRKCTVQKTLAAVSNFLQHNKILPAVLIFGEHSCHISGTMATSTGALLHFVFIICLLFPSWRHGIHFYGYKTVGETLNCDISQRSSSNMAITKGIFNQLSFMFFNTWHHGSSNFNVISRPQDDVQNGQQYGFRRIWKSFLFQTR